MSRIAHLKPFQKGGPGGPGRPKGSRNAIAEDFLSKLQKHFAAKGEQALDDALTESPLGYVKMVASLLPQKLEIEKVVSHMTDDELLAIARGNSERAAHRVPPPNVDDVGTA